MESVIPVSGGCSFNNNVSRNRILESLKDEGIVAPTFSQLRQVARDTIGDDIHFWINEQKRVPSYEKKYRITERGLEIADGSKLDGKLFHEVFIDRARELGPKLGYIPDEKELTRLELFEKAVLGGANRFVTATSFNGNFRYLEKWSVTNDGMVIVQGRDIGKIAKQDLSEKAIGKVIQNTIGLSKTQSIDKEGILFRVDEEKFDSFFAKATQIVQKHSSVSTVSIDNTQFQSRAIIDKSPVDRLYVLKTLQTETPVNSARLVIPATPFDYSNNRRKQMKEEKLTEMPTLRKVETYKNKQSRMSLLGLGVFVYELWQKRRTRQLEQKKGAKLIILKPKEVFFHKVRRFVIEKIKKVTHRENRAKPIAIETKQVTNIQKVSILQRVHNAIILPQSLNYKRLLQPIRLVKDVIKQKPIQVKDRLFYLPFKIKDRLKSQFRLLQQIASKIFFINKTGLQRLKQKINLPIVHEVKKGQKHSIRERVIVAGERVWKKLDNVAQLVNVKLKRIKRPLLQISHKLLIYGLRLLNDVKVAKREYLTQHSHKKKLVRFLSSVLRFIKKWNIIPATFYLISKNKKHEASKVQVLEDENLPIPELKIPLFYFFCIWQLWLQFTSDLQFERPQGIFAGQQVTVPVKNKKVKKIKTIYQFFLHKQQGSVIVG